MSDLERRLQKLEKAAGQQVSPAALEKAGEIDRPTRLWLEALEQAREPEIAALEEARSRAEREHVAGRPIDRSSSVHRFLALQEDLQRRTAPTLANDMRVSRDLCWRAIRAELRRVEEVAEADDALYGLAEQVDALDLAEVQRAAFIKDGGQPCTDPSSAREMLERVLEVARSCADPSQIARIENLVEVETK